MRTHRSSRCFRLNRLLRAPRICGGWAIASIVLSAAIPYSRAATFRITLATNVVSEAAWTNATTATVWYDPAPTNALPVTVIISDPLEIGVPNSVIIPAGTNRVVFPLAVTRNDGEVDGSISVSISVGAGTEIASTTLVIMDDDTPTRRTLGGQVAGLLSFEQYTVVSPLLVGSGARLTIAPATTLRFMPGCGLTVDGSVIVVGEVGREIRFVSSLGTPTNGSWTGINIRGSNQERSLLEHIEVAHAESGLLVNPMTDRAEVSLTRSAIWGALQNGVEIVGQDGGFFLGSSNIVIQGNSIYANEVDGVYLHSRVQQCGNSRLSASVVANDLFGNGKAGIEIAVTTGNGCTAVRVKTHDAYIAANRIYGNGSGITAQLRSAGQARGRWSSVVENNLIFNNSSNGIAMSGPNIAEFAPRIVNNSIIHNGRSGILHGTNVDTGFALLNNVVVWNQQGIAASSPFLTNFNLRAAFNDVWGNNGDWVNYPPSYGRATFQNANEDPTDSEGNISMDPLFVGIADYHLLPESPLVDAGTSDSAPAYDVEGQPRRGPPDIGFDELATVRLAATAPPTDGAWVVRVTGGRGTPCQWETSFDFAHWISGTSFVLSNRTDEVSVPSDGSNHQFFRIRTLP